MPTAPNRCQCGQEENLKTASYLKLPGEDNRIPVTRPAGGKVLGAVRAWGKERKSGEKRTQAETAEGAPGSGSSVPRVAVSSNYCFKYPGVLGEKKVTKMSLSLLIFKVSSQLYLN